MPKYRIGHNWPPVSAQILSKGRPYEDISGYTFSADLTNEITRARRVGTGSFVITDGARARYQYLPSAYDISLAGSFVLAVAHYRPDPIGGGSYVLEHEEKIVVNS